MTEYIMKVYFYYCQVTIGTEIVDSSTTPNTGFLMQPDQRTNCKIDFWNYDCISGSDLTWYNAF